MNAPGSIKEIWLWLKSRAGQTEKLQKRPVVKLVILLKLKDRRVDHDGGIRLTGTEVKRLEENLLHPIISCTVANISKTVKQQLVR